MSYDLIRGDATQLPLADDSVDLIATSPPYFDLRSYQDGGEHYDGQIGSEDTPQEFLEALWVWTAECRRVLKPSGSLWVNLGDKYAGGGMGGHGSGLHGPPPQGERNTYRRPKATGIPAKSLMGLPWRYAIGCIDQLGLILRAEIIWSKPNGLPESVTDRVRRSHEQWFHMTKEPRYFSAVDEIREAYQPSTIDRNRYAVSAHQPDEYTDTSRGVLRDTREAGHEVNPLGKLPGSVWTVPTEPLRVPDHIGVDHFACVDAETEILTDAGWITHDQLRQGAMVAGYNLDTCRAEWTRCHAVHRYDYDGPIVAVEKRDLSMRLTPNHRCIIQRGAGRRDVVRADELLPAHRIPRSATWEPYERKSIGEPLAALLGWVAAEGWVTSAGSVYLSQSLTENPDHVAAIDDLLARVDVPPITTRRTKHRTTMNTLHRKQRTRTYLGREWEDVTWRLPLGLAQQITSLLDDKLLTWAMLWLPENERRAMLDAFIDGDGHRRDDGRIGIFQKHRQNLDVLQAIAVTLGYRTSLTEQADRFVLYLTSGQRWITLRGAAGEATPIPTEHYTGTVWCPTTGTGTFIARRRGRVFITGNSFPSEWPRRLILGWSPSGVCVECGQGRRPVVAKELEPLGPNGDGRNRRRANIISGGDYPTERGREAATITGYACACDNTDAPTRPAVVLDPFCGTGTVPAVAHALGRHGIGIDLSADYLRLAEWRCNDPGLRAKVAERSGPEFQRTVQRERETAKGVEPLSIFEVSP